MISGAPHRTRILLLGGTAEARQLAERIADDPRFDAILSLAGRTAHPELPAIAVRIGGFGGVDGLSSYLTREKINVVLDATHPFAAHISANAVAACLRSRVTLMALERPPWQHQAGDDWIHHTTVEDAIAALPRAPMRIFSGLGRLSLDAMSAAPHHYFVIRVIDPLAAPLPLPGYSVIHARGPFKTEDDIALFREHKIEAILAKNAGGNAAVSKIDAARALGLPVHMIDRPAIPPREVVTHVEQALARLADHHASPANRGV